MPWADGTTTPRTAAALEGLVVNEFAGGIVGTGDNQQYTAATTAAQLLAIKDGTAAAPDTSLNPLVKVERKIGAITDTSISGDGCDELSALSVFCEGTAACEVQPVAVQGIAKNSGTTNGGGVPAPDACGLYGIGWTLGSGVGVGIGAYLEGRSSSASGKVTGAEIRSTNLTGSDHSVNTTAFNNSQAMWVCAGGTQRSAAGLAFGNPFGFQFDVGVLFNGQVAGGFTGPTLTADIQSNSTATNAILVNGTHTYALRANDAGGRVLLGTGDTAFTSAKIKVESSSGTGVDPGIIAFGTSGSIAVSAVVGNGSGQSKWFAAHGTNAFLTGTVAGDGGIAALTSGKSFHLGGTISTIEVTRANALGFHNVATPIAKPTGWGAPTGTATRTTFDTSTVTLPELAERVRGLIDDLTAYGLIGA